jgi:hypothetical protein
MGIIEAVILMKNQLLSVIGFVLHFAVSSAFVVGVVGVLWFFLWKYILEPNPLVRDFFDLDQKGK